MRFKTLINQILATFSKNNLKLILIKTFLYLYKEMIEALHIEVFDNDEHCLKYIHTYIYVFVQRINLK